MAVTDIENIPGHEVLALAGKKVLRPGGIAATRKLFSWAEFKSGKSLLELASSFGLNLEVLSHEYGLDVTGIDRNQASVERAKKAIADSDKAKIHIKLGDILKLDAVSDNYDYILAEAILTMQTDGHKRKILRDAYDKLNPGGLMLMHELVFTEDVKEMHRELSQIIRVNANALTADGWSQMLGEAGFEVVKLDTGPMSLLTPRGLLRDEGLLGTLKIVGNVVTNAKIRKRVLAMRGFFSANANKLAHITICARKKSA